MIVPSPELNYVVRPKLTTAGTPCCDRTNLRIRHLVVPPGRMPKSIAVENVSFPRMKTEHLLAAYGTLRPGEINHRLLADVPGEWLDGWVRGYVGEEDGYPAFWYSPDAARQPVKVFHSAELPGIWSHLDWFEGKNWPRTVVPVELAQGGTVQANLYQRVGRPPRTCSDSRSARTAGARQASESVVNE